MTTTSVVAARFISAAEAIRRHPGLNHVVLYRLAALRKVDVALGSGENIRYSASDLSRIFAPPTEGATE